MLEKLYQKVCAKLASAAKTKTETASGPPAAPRAAGLLPVSWVKKVPPGVWVLGIVLAITAGGALHRRQQMSGGHRREIANAIGSIGFFYGAPQPDNAGSRVFYFRTSEEGMGVFATDVASGKRETLFDGTSIYYPDVHNGISPVSPDDSLFAYTLDSRDTSGYLAICLADSGKEVGRVKAPAWDVTEMAWLAPDKLVCMGRANWVRTVHDINHLFLVQRQRNGRWTSSQLKVAPVNASSLVALSSNSLAWVDDNGIRSLDIASSSAVTIFKPKGRQATEVSYSQQTGEFLVTCREATQPPPKGGKGAPGAAAQLYSLWRLKLESNGPASTELVSESDIHSAQWVGGGKGYAYLQKERLAVAASIGDKPIKPPLATVEALKAPASGDGLFFTGTAGNEPWAGLWRYDISSQAVSNVVPYSDSQTPYAVRSDPIAVNTRVGGARRYFIYRPTHFSPHRKYPLVICDTPFMSHTFQNSASGPSWAEALTASGAYVVLVDRRSWFGDIENWGKEVVAVYNLMKSEPTVDTGRCFLVATSAETGHIWGALEKHAGLWKGIVLFNPSALPDLDALKPDHRLPRMLISAGAMEDESERFRKYRDEACRHGISVQTLEHTNAGHYTIAISTVRERTLRMVEFVFKD